MRRSIHRVTSAIKLERDVGYTKRRRAAPAIKPERICRKSNMPRRRLSRNATIIMPKRRLVTSAIKLEHEKTSCHVGNLSRNVTMDTPKRQHVASVIKPKRENNSTAAMNKPDRHDNGEVACCNGLRGYCFRCRTQET